MTTSMTALSRSERSSSAARPSARGRCAGLSAFGFPPEVVALVELAVTTRRGAMEAE